MTKHDDDLRETRRRWLELTDSAAVYEQMSALFADHPELLDYWQATYDLAKAYYEQFCSDDDAPADFDWIVALALSVRNGQSVDAWRVTVHSATVHTWCVRKWGGPYVSTVHVSTDMTRGQVRRLLTAMGVEVRQ